ncbi:MAG TPA: NAD(P)/FAD-dependent oxidoreductase [Steroidobacter sp.]
MSAGIVIVGAGAAGIAAARWLVDHGHRPIVLEARSRAGGRAWTDTSTFGFPIDRGWAWLHSANVNPWTSYARQAGFTLIERSPVWQQRIGAQEATPERLQAWRAAYERNDRLIEQAALAGRDVPVSELVPADEYRPTFDAVITWLMGTESDRVSSVDYSRYADTGVNWAVREGLGSVVAHAARGLDIRLGTRVRLIDWSRRRVRVETDRGTLEASAVIITVPTSVLARGDCLRFEPELPAAMVEAFSGIPLGMANKVFFELEPGALPFEGSVHFIGTDRSARTASYQARPSGQEVLLAYFGGSLALELEERGELEAFARDQLAEIFGASFRSKIRRATTTAWASEEYSRGAYSAALPGKAHLREHLTVPVAERLFFAGEACSLDSFGTIHGAWASATQAAGAVLKTIAAT